MKENINWNIKQLFKISWNRTLCSSDPLVCKSIGCFIFTLELNFGRSSQCSKMWVVTRAVLLSLEPTFQYLQKYWLLALYARAVTSSLEWWSRILEFPEFFWASNTHSRVQIYAWFTQICKNILNYIYLKLTLTHDSKFHEFNQIQTLNYM